MPENDANSYENQGRCSDRSNFDHISRSTLGLVYAFKVSVKPCIPIFSNSQVRFGGDKIELEELTLLSI